MSQQIRYQLWIAAAASVIFFINLGDAGLWDMDEALYTSCAREMFDRGDWVVPWFNGQMFPEKPPLMFWTMIAGFELFGGVSELGARFFSAVMGVATALIAFHLGRLLFNVRVGFWTGLITASTIVFTISARAATVDCALTFVTTAAMLLFVMAKRSGIGARGSENGGLGTSVPSSDGKRSGPESQIPIPESRPPNPDPRPLYWPYASLMYACIGLAVLAKGPVGMVLPLAVIGLYMLIEGGWRRVFRSAWEMRPLTAIVVIAAVAAPWYVLVGLKTDGQWLQQFFFEFNLRPFRQPILGHGDASSLQHAWAVTVSILYYFYHVPAILFGFFPWSVFLGPTLIHTYQCLRNKSTSRSHAPRGNVGCVLAVCWFGVWFVFWSVCKTKLPHYLLPAYPALAMLTAWWIDRWLEGEKETAGWSSFASRWPRNAWISTILTGLGIIVAIPIVAAYYLPG
ncbi:MAG: glycosyltransferase family 39 protein, partial [Pirellulales bacterium]|nr:glycosyltransferase family 39 protein [Pirellulales bacterium]